MPKKITFPPAPGDLRYDEDLGEVVLHNQIVIFKGTGWDKSRFSVVNI